MQCINVTNINNTVSLKAVYSPPLFTVNIYFALMFVWLLVAFVAYFTLVQRTKPKNVRNNIYMNVQL
jgi:hypothetical protein